MNTVLSKQVIGFVVHKRPPMQKVIVIKHQSNESIDMKIICVQGVFLE